VTEAAESPWTIRPFESLSDYRACAELQEETWGVGFSERVPTAILKVTQILGGVSAGAWSSDGRLLGFVFGMTGLKDGRLVHWSDMLAVRPEARSTGLGTALKRNQRDRMLSLDVGTVLWTFDPLRARNAHFNFTILGVRAHEYVVDMYGATDSPLHRGIGTDRLVAVWDLRDPGVVARCEGRPAPMPGDGAVAVLESRVGPDGLPHPTAPVLDVVADRLFVALPADIGRLMEVRPELASSWREATRATLVHYLDRGWTVSAFDRTSSPPGYLLSRTAPESSETR
jgi:predicted GNAT superfamily acetyltransferase